jgi:hypothetical protein
MHEGLSMMPWLGLGTARNIGWPLEEKEKKNHG